MGTSGEHEPFSLQPTEGVVTSRFMADQAQYPAGTWHKIQGTAVEHCASIALRADVPVLLISLRGCVVTGSSRTDVALAISKAVHGASRAAPEPEVAVLDVTEFADSSLFDDLGKFVDWLPRKLAGRLWLWAARASCAAPLESWFGARSISPSVDAAIDELVARRKSGSVEERLPDGQLLSRGSWTDRGFVETEFEQEGGSVTSLWFRTRLIERTEHTAAGDVKWQTFWPFPDRSGHLNPACHVGARMVVENGRIRELDFNPEQTEQPLPANWVDSIRNHEALAELEELGLLNTSVTESAVVEVLEHLPHLRRLNLANTQVTDALANALSRGLSPNLEQLCIDNSWTAASARAILAEARPDLYVG